MPPKQDFHTQLRNKMDTYAHLVYITTKQFPKDEIYGITSQLRRSALSVSLNYIEGYARMRSKVQRNFIEISYGSLQESKYLIEFSYKEKYMSLSEYKLLFLLADDIGKMLWGMLRKMSHES